MQSRVLKGPQIPVHDSSDTDSTYEEDREWFERPNLRRSLCRLWWIAMGKRLLVSDVFTIDFSRTFGVMWWPFMDFFEHKVFEKSFNAYFSVLVTNIWKRIVEGSRLISPSGWCLQNFIQGAYFENQEGYWYDNSYNHNPFFGVKQIIDVMLVVVRTCRVNLTLHGLFAAAKPIKFSLRIYNGTFSTQGGLRVKAWPKVPNIVGRIIEVCGLFEKVCANHTFLDYFHVWWWGFGSLIANLICGIHKGYQGQLGTCSPYRRIKAPMAFFRPSLDRILV